MKCRCLESKVLIYSNNIRVPKGEKVTWDVAIFEKVTWGHGLPKSDLGKICDYKNGHALLTC